MVILRKVERLWSRTTLCRNDKLFCSVCIFIPFCSFSSTLICRLCLLFQESTKTAGKRKSWCLVNRDCRICVSRALRRLSLRCQHHHSLLRIRPEKKVKVNMLLKTIMSICSRLSWPLILHPLRSHNRSTFSREFSLVELFSLFLFFLLHWSSPRFPVFVGGSKPGQGRRISGKTTGLIIWSPLSVIHPLHPLCRYLLHMIFLKTPRSFSLIGLGAPLLPLPLIIRSVSDSFSLRFWELFRKLLLRVHILGLPEFTSHSSSYWHFLIHLSGPWDVELLLVDDLLRQLFRGRKESCCKCSATQWWWWEFSPLHFLSPHVFRIVITSPSII